MDKVKGSKRSLNHLLSEYAAVCRREGKARILCKIADTDEHNQERDIARGERARVKKLILELYGDE